MSNRNKFLKVLDFKNSPIQSFIIILLTFLLCSFLIHAFILKMFEQPVYGAKIILAYGLNFLLAGGSFVFLYKSSKTKTDLLGYYFLAGSLVKFAMFFIFFNPSYRADGVVSSVEFAAFFTPYAICLALETIFLVSVLNKTKP